MTIESYRPKISKNLKNLFLDPNNYRFVDNDEHKFVPEKDIMDPVIQKRTRNFIEGVRQENIKDLILSFKANGFLDVDVIQVKDLGNNNYLVLEGNRRVTALKFLFESYEKGNDIGKLDPNIFKSVPFEIHDNDDVEKHLIIMGLKHISGNKKWSTFNQSKLLYDFLKPYENKGRDEYLNKEDELVNSLGILKTRLRSMLRVYNLILAYKQSEYGEQFEPNMFGIFEEIIKKPVLKSWLEWNDNGYYARNEVNLNRLFSWISKTEEYVETEVEDDYNDDDFISDEKGEFKEFDPIITKSLEVRELAAFINNERALKVMEEERSLIRGFVSSDSVNQQNYKNALSKLEDSLKNLENYKNLIVAEDVKGLECAKEKLVNLMPTKSTLNIEAGNFTTNFEYGVKHHFKSIHIKKYKLFKDFEVAGFNRINIFAGMNNTGKTSILEAIYLLTQRNDISSYLNLIKNKNKFSSLNPSLLNAVFQDKIVVSGCFDDSTVSVEMIKFDDASIDKQDDYIASYKLSSEVDGEILTNLIHTFTHERMIRNSSQVSHLCSASFKSPYFYDVDELIKDYNKSLGSNLISLKKEDAVNVKSAISLVIDFLNSIEPSIKDVRFTEEMDLKRFIVESSNNSERNFDLTSYGEGIQRIFYIALSFAACRNGVLFIDEFETAIHYTLLLDFTRLTQKLANRFNVQLFLTSHSNECIRAFMENGSENETITGFQLIKNEDGIIVKRAVGDRFGYLIKNLNLDIRG
ncbi:AAA family ATPase [Pantoea ananatis]|uniref:AAA family ATPase n=1 Tax=Pantoea ananas TaxID=553 RepID=UPI0024B706E5|nr:AAA family ATPase [Pantoea ananatis]MDJ0046877.1 AAA family ATPase [Pantoea ananatis]